MKVLMIGDVVGSPGRRILREQLPRIRRELGVALRLVGHDMKVTDYLDTGHLNYQVPPGWWVDNN